ncbi:unnamed protein product [Pleuronectes platessa]|uniref:V-set and transmembrane domain containing 2A n=1 Tax=Pleuronectes platessa TaxID=8262 RepID=A0A9N7U6T4_PLEPL|nr:unnamed protein product [Pleuronectes platessa]
MSFIPHQPPSEKGHELICVTVEPSMSSGETSSSSSSSSPPPPSLKPFSAAPLLLFFSFVMEMIPEPDPDDEGTKISTVKVQGNDISHKLQMSRVSKSDEGLYECRVTRANYGEIVEYKVQAWLKVNTTARPRRPLTPPKKSSPLHLTDKKPRKSNSPQDSMSSDQRVSSTSTSHTSSNTVQQNPGSAAQTALATFYEQQRGVELRATEFYYSCAQVGGR